MSSEEKMGDAANGQPTVVYGDQAGLRIGMTVMTIVFLTLSCVLIWVTLTGMTQMADRMLGAFVSLLLIALTVPCAYYAGPNCLSIHFADRTYLSMRGFPFLPRIYTGTLEDMAELYLRERSYQGTTNWHLMAGWKEPGRAAFRMQIFEDLKTAQEQMQGLAERLGIPADTKPRPWSGW